jgi:hypothetical protein
MDWCEESMQAVDPPVDAWDWFAETKEASEVILSFLVHMIDEEGNSIFGICGTTCMTVSRS